MSGARASSDASGEAMFVVLARGLNVGRANRMTMAAFREALEAAGCRDPRTHLQSGNAVVRAPADAPPAELEARIGAALSERAGGDVTARVLTVERLRRVVEGLPFPEAAASPATLHAYFLAAEPEPGADARLAEIATPSERVVVAGDVAYLDAPDGIGRSKLAASAERRLGVPATSRNWRTVTALLSLADAQDGT